MAGIKAAVEKLGAMKYALLVAAVGLLLLVWPGGAEEAPEADAEQMRLETLLGQIEGVGEVHLLLSEQGAAVVCAGADSAEVCLKICRALHCYTGLGSDRIQVFKLKSNYEGNALKRNLKRNIVVAAVLVFVGAAVYLNWSYNARWGTASAAMAKAEDEAMAAAGEDALAVSAETGDAVSAYFAKARLTRQQSRDEAMQMLENACAASDASQDVIDEAMRQINTMAQWSMAESVMESELLARDFAECVVFAGTDAITVAVPAPEEGLDETAVAQITQTVLSSSDYEASQLNIIEIKN